MVVQKLALRPNQKKGFPYKFGLSQSKYIENDKEFGNVAWGKPFLGSKENTHPTRHVGPGAAGR